jgi:hypothetical protein
MLSVQPVLFFFASLEDTMNRYPLLTGFFFGFGLGLSGCTGDGNCSPADCAAGTATGPDCESDCADDSGGTDPSATFIGPPVLFNSLQESCQTNLSGPGSYTALTDEEIEVKPGEYELTFGDPALASSASDDLPLHVASNGWLAVSPRVPLTVDDGDTQRPAAPPMNLFIQGTWTCEDDTGFVDSGSVSYKNGYLLTLPSVGSELEVTGMAIDFEDAERGIETHGAFISDSWLNLESTGSAAGDFTADCWAGSVDQDPR